MAVCGKEGASSKLELNYLPFALTASINWPGYSKLPLISTSSSARARNGPRTPSIIFSQPSGNPSKTSATWPSVLLPSASLPSALRRLLDLRPSVYPLELSAHSTSLVGFSVHSTLTLVLSTCSNHSLCLRLLSPAFPQNNLPSGNLSPSSNACPYLLPAAPHSPGLATPSRLIS